MMNKRGFTVDESLSNLTSSASCTEASASASSFARTDHNFIFSASPPPLKKKRNLPGNPDPDAEVVALSPKSLLATNRFLCEICGKGFQRDQNLQLHRRGHNLPWKLKQRSSKEAIRKKVYVCPEATCVHHDPSRALGDLTGIKKHFCRKHGEKKWKCEKCAKTYAVQSDWKAHSKICGTREYRCDCGTLFSRRDSFITHRAFCDAIAMESARAANPFVPAAAPAASPLNHNGLHAHLGGGGLFWKRELHAPHHPLHSPLRSTDNIPSPWLSTPQPAVHGPIPGPAPPPIDLSPSLFSPLSDSLLLAPRDHVDPHHPNPSPNPNPNNLPPYHPTPPPFSSSSHMYSATALLQKAAQMGVTTSHHHHAPFWSFSRDTGFAVPDHDNNLSSSSFAPPHHDVMMMSGTSMASSAAVGHDVPHQGLVGVLEDGLDAMLNPRMGGGGFPDRLVMRASPPPGGADRLRRSDEGGCGGVVNDGLTRDFLGLRSFSERDFLHIAGIRDHMNAAAAAAAVSTSSPQTPKNQNGTFPWQ